MAINVTNKNYPDMWSSSLEAEDGCVCSADNELLYRGMTIYTPCHYLLARPAIIKSIYKKKVLYNFDVNGYHGCKNSFIYVHPENSRKRGLELYECATFDEYSDHNSITLLCEIANEIGYMVDYHYSNFSKYLAVAIIQHNPIIYISIRHGTYRIAVNCSHGSNLRDEIDMHEPDSFQKLATKIATIDSRVSV